MAPKKKKKAAANAARGFTTTSVPSKPRPDEAAEDARSDAEVTNSSTPISLPTHGSSIKGTQNPAIQDMHPDQLEQYLEDVELQALLDANSTRCKSDATRQISRLKTEIRQLRSQAMTLSTIGWLPVATIDYILTSSMTRPSSPSPATDILLRGDHIVLLDLWVLQQVLSSLALPRVDDALAHVLQVSLTHPIESDSGYAWGLSTALDWYALTCSLKELPDYQASSVPEPSDSPKLSAVAEQTGMFEMPSYRRLDHF